MPSFFVLSWISVLMLASLERANSAPPFTSTWSSQGGNPSNTRDVSTSGSLVSEYSLDLTTPTFSLRVGNSTSATPAIRAGMIFFPALDGTVKAYSKATGSLVWSKSINSVYYSGERYGAVSYTTPVFFGSDRMVLGVGFPADLLIIDTVTGNLVWKINLDDHPYSQVASSGTVRGNLYYVGVSSIEDSVAAENEEYPCCTFVGSFQAIDLEARSVAWSFSTIPSDQAGPGQWSGIPVLASTPPVEKLTKTVYFATGKAYSSPDHFAGCEDETDPASQESLCFVASYPSVWANSVVALDAVTGAVKSAKRFGPHLSWTASCANRFADCSDSSDPASPFTMAPSLGYHATCNCPAARYSGNADDVLGASDTNFVGTCVDPRTGFNTKAACNPSSSGYAMEPFLYVGQTNGIAYKLSGLDLRVIWATKVGPAGKLGGLANGGALDDRRYYLGVVNDLQNPWTLVNGTSVRGGGWVALDKLTGAVLWTTANPANYDPSGQAGDASSNGRTSTAWGLGPPASILNALLVSSFDCAKSPNMGTYSESVPKPGGGSKIINVGSQSNRPAPGVGGYVYELDKVRGAVVSSFKTGSSVGGGFSVGADCAWVGSGYATALQGTPGNYTYGWCISQDNFYSSAFKRVKMIL
jgi:polyvinyl alcohol dehydrogenase (cytochrome)